MSANVSPGDGSQHDKVPPIVYSASTGRRLTFSFVFLILLPFFLSLPGMLYLRLSNGHVLNSAGLAIVAIAFAAIMFLVLVELLYSVRARVVLGEETAKLTLPSGRGPTPMLRYKTHVVPYDQVQAVETRREVYGGSVTPVLLKGARLLLKDGSHVRLGYVSEANVDPTFPYPEIAAKIAERARLPVIDRGNVRRSFRNKFLGLRIAPKAVSDVVDETQIDELNRSHSNVVMWLMGGLVILMLIGLVEDLSTRTPAARAGLAASSASSGR